MKAHKTIAQEMNEKLMEWENALSKRFHFTASRLAQLRQLLKKEMDTRQGLSFKTAGKKQRRTAKRIG